MKLRSLIADPEQSPDVRGGALDVSRRALLLAGGSLAITQLTLAQRCIAACGMRWSLPALRGFRTIDTVWVPMQDGTRIAVRLWIPDGAEQAPVPVVMEYIPYGRMRAGEMPRILASHGIAYARPDIRGTGDSEGVLSDEYLQQEQDDGVELIAWLAKQHWCNGSVGMRGLSWGGFSALQMAALAPPALKAIMPHCASVNRYTDDVHYVGGVLARGNGDWGTAFRNLVAQPPNPRVVGADRWRRMWMERLNAAAPIIARWTQHQRYDRFWQHGSVATDYSRIRCPVYAVGGQIDAYRDFIPRLLANLEVPRLGLMGPWGHRYPNHAEPGTGLDWAVEEVRWWSHWLSGQETGIMDAPMLRVYMETQTAAEVWPQDTPGRWITEPRWPSENIATELLYLNPDGLGSAKGREEVRECESQETIGLAMPDWLPLEMNQQLPREQTPDDEKSVLFDTAPLDSNVEIVGNPKARVRLSSDEPVARLAVRVNEVTPAGKSWCVTYGILNLTHRDSHQSPSPLEPGRLYDIEVSCYFAAHRFQKGNRIRVAISESLWPMVWPSPRPVRLSIVTGASTLALPIRPPESVEGTSQNPRTRNRIEGSAGKRTASALRVKSDGKDRTTIESKPAAGTGWSASIREGDPNSCTWSRQRRSILKRAGLVITLDASFELTSTPEEFHLKEALRASEGGTEVFSRQWDRQIKRDLM